jgi:two-component system KDP operon response regulator KdpE
MRYAPLVLLVEDDRGMRNCLRTTLLGERFRVVETESGGEALTQAVAHNPDLVVLDYGLPDLNGTQVTARLREWSAAPIVIVSVNDHEADKVAALDAGANDYVTKPFGAPELLARIRVWLRHSQRAVANSNETAIELGELKVDFAQHRAYLRGSEVPLTPTQFKLFAALMRDAGRVLTHEQLLATVWGPSRTKETQYLRIYMGQLRRKFEPDPVRCQYFITEPGVGYRLRVA